MYKVIGTWSAASPGRAKEFGPHREAVHARAASVPGLRKTLLRAPTGWGADATVGGAE